jgi:histidyl-tRNA synthetase
VSKSIIEPRILKGFRDSLPRLAASKSKITRIMEDTFCSFGFLPIDTPALEYTEVLLGKGSSETDKQMYRFEDNGGRDVSLRFDLTIPLARFAAMHIHELGTPFKRYHIAPVWRAEKPQRGRYREFIQCDFDIIGTRSLLADVEIISIIRNTLEALNLDCTIRINNRLLLSGVLSMIGAGDKLVVVLRTIDKLEKLGADTVEQELKTDGQLSDEQVKAVFSYLNLSKESENNQQLLSLLRKHYSSNEIALKGIEQLEFIIKALSGLAIDDTLCKIDLSIARGLDYYTGTVFETSLNALPDIGSICSGGRYDNLASLYTKTELPGVGASFGLDRLIAALDELKQIPENSSSAQVFVTILDDGTEADCLSIANSLRAKNISAEISLTVGKLGNQLKHANKRGINLAVIAGKSELGKNVCNLKNLSTGEQQDNISLNQLAQRVKELL